MTRGTTFGLIHSHSNLHLIQQKQEISPASVKTSFVEIPGSNGSRDLTEALGLGVLYGDRELSWTFGLYPGEDWAAKRSQVSNTLSGQRFHITLHDDPQWFYDGRVVVAGYKSDKILHQITVKATCDPYKRKHTESTVTKSLNTSDTSIVLAIGAMPLIPEITVDAVTTITYGSVVRTLPVGLHFLPAFRMSGTQTISAKVTTGTGTITIKWREGSL